MAEEQENTTLFTSFIKNIETRISSLATLEIKTIIGDYRVEGTEEILPKKDGDFKVMSSKIRLVEGDMTTYISNELVQDKYAWLREFHALKEEKGHEIINGNIRAIMSLYDLYNRTKGVELNEENMDETELEGL